MEWDSCCAKPGIFTPGSPNFGDCERLPFPLEIVTLSHER